MNNVFPVRSQFRQIKSSLERWSAGRRIGDLKTSLQRTNRSLQRNRITARGDWERATLRSDGVYHQKKRALIRSTRRGWIRRRRYSTGTIEPDRYRAGASIRRRAARGGFGGFLGLPQGSIRALCPLNSRLFRMTGGNSSHWCDAEGDCQKKPQPGCQTQCCFHSPNTSNEFQPYKGSRSGQMHRLLQ